MTLQVDIAMQGGGWREEADWPQRLEAALAASLAESGVALAPAAEVSVVLTEDAAVRELNLRWRGLDEATNVLSFPAAAPGALAVTPLLGDIVVAYETAAREAEAEGKALGDHTTHLVVHGFLHLLGHDHDGAEEAEAMEGLERRILARLGIADPYRDGLPDGEALP